MPTTWHVSDDGGVIEDINGRSDAIKADFVEMLLRLVVDPRDVRLGVARYNDPNWPGDGRTVPFDDALLFYSLTPDIPTIRLQYVIWLTSHAG